MIYKSAVILIVSLGIFMSCVGLNTARYALPGAINVATPTYAQNKEYDNPQLDKLIRDLRSNNENERANAKRALLALSGKSEATRASVIKELLKIIKTPTGSIEFVKDPGRYLEWKEATDVVGSIRAVEAIDDLIGCLDCNNGIFGLSPDRFPATMAIIKIGEDAIPKLSQDIELRPPLVRYLVAVALAQIGGDKAKSRLVKAIQKEKDKEISSAMKNLLQNWNSSNKHQPQ